MQPELMARRAYSEPSPAVQSPRRVEYAAFAKVTQALAALSDRAPTAGLAPLAQALHRNRQLWTVLACDVAAKENPLPEALKANILYLAEFTFTQSAKVLQGQANVAALVDVNRAIMRGLHSKGDQS